MYPKAKQAWLLLAALVILALPPMQRFLEQSMVMHMLVQIPALVIIGWITGKILPENWKDNIAPWNRWGITGIALAIIIMTYWMLPRVQDAAISEWPVELTKFITVPIMGMALGISWPQLNPIAQGVLKLEFWATFMRLGWLYLDLPDRLCANYLLSDQRVFGQLLLLAGSIWAVAWTLRIMFGIRIVNT
ncbi:hypothetical protein SAMN05216339_101142 [Nitrosomonas eutropha]|uniref:Transmembrane protein n=1 Tax=Nitrosomonas eutropha TaxID=916 RepID=A0A1I7EX05_9PROT|nr:hypothetical protein [Nitrosomonas eutropha]SFU28490.1 hypothetical protein SAMN05216339_101142 [Nitrosomonas eutropha]